MHVIQTIARSVRAELDASADGLDAPSDLGGACAFATVLLARAFDFYTRKRRRPGKHPYITRPVVVMGWFQRSKHVAVQHCWIEVLDVIVDVTATQFGAFPKARICPRNNPRYAMMTASGTDALRYMRRFPISPHRRRRRLQSMAARVYATVSKELGL